MYAKVKGRDLLKILGIGYNGHHAIFVVSGIKLEYDNSHLVRETVEVVIRDTVTLDSIGVRRYVLPMARVRVLEVNGKPFHPDSTYLLATNDYLMHGGGEYLVFRTAKDVRDTGKRISYIVEEYLKHVGRIKPKVEGRIKKTRFRL
jgi:2',3'-cyclic-nucleotide 2'-phosphodiesterase (5'-nucleotidase family)